MKLIDILELFTRRFVNIDNIEILDEHIIYQNGPYKRIKRWIKGVHPQLGVVIKGLTGWETMVEKDVIKPLHKFQVV